MPGLLVSDREREYTVGLLREHMLSGRLTPDEFEERVDEAWRARFAEDLWHALRYLPVDRLPAPRPQANSGSGTASVVLGVMGLCILCMSFGLFFALALPLSASAWAFGREARRSGGHRRARTGEILGIVGTVLSLLSLASCASVVAG